MKNFFMTFLIALISSFQLNASSTFDGKCFDGSDFKFEWEWCSSNSAIDKPVENTCFGKLIYTDILNKAVQLELNKDGIKSYECLFDRGPWIESKLENCQRAIEREYTAAFGIPRTTKITECIGNDGLVKWISGKSFEGYSFTSRPK